MDNLPELWRNKLIFMILALCLSSLVICEVIDPLLGCGNNWDVSFTNGFVQQTHLDEHDDDYVLTKHSIGNFVPITIEQDRSSKLWGNSCFLSPLLPPPKAS
jgi:hypothetical protein